MRVDLCSETEYVAWTELAQDKDRWLDSSQWWQPYVLNNNMKFLDNLNNYQELTTQWNHLLKALWGLIIISIDL
jgi:hypothetical protein